MVNLNTSVFFFSFGCVLLELNAMMPFPNPSKIPRSWRQRFHQNVKDRRLFARSHAATGLQQNILTQRCNRSQQSSRKETFRPRARSQRLSEERRALPACAGSAEEAVFLSELILGVDPEGSAERRWQACKTNAQLAGRGRRGKTKNTPAASWRVVRSPRD